MISPQGCFTHDATLHHDGHGAWVGAAADDGRISLIGPRPSVTIGDARLTLTRHPDTSASQAAPAAHVDCGHAPEAMLRDGDVLTCHRDLRGEVGLSVIRAGRLVLYLGASAGSGSTRLRIDHDPRVEDTVFARQIGYISRPGTVIYWLDPSRPEDLQLRLREIEAPTPGVPLRAIVVRTDDEATRLDLNRQTMQTRRYREGATIFLTAPERFPTLDAWLAHGRSLSRERPADLWVSVRIDGSEARIPQGTTTTIGDWLVHVHRVDEPGVPGRNSMVGIVATDAGVSAAMLEASAAAVTRGVHIERPVTGHSTPR